jgi:hypothetical protein
MQKIALVNLILRNFKGMKQFELNANGGNAAVYGDNATGKTSIADAFLWIFTGKDSQGKQAENSIKTLTASGEEVHHLDHEAEAILAMGGRTVSLKKVYHEIWTKKRGAATDSFTGHETEHFIDGVPKSKKEYDAFVSGIAGEETFRLLTNPAYFNTQLHWQDRRRILMEVCGDVSDEEVIASDNSLARLRQILNGRAIKDHQKVIASQKAEINKQLKEIPARIDEATRALPDVSSVSPAEVIDVEISSLKKQLADKQQELVRVENGGEVAEKQKAAREIEGRLIDLRNKHRAANEDKTFAKRNELQKLQLQASGMVNDIKTKELRLASIRNDIDSSNQKRTALLDRWHSVNNEQFTYSEETNCPTCGQDLPESKVAEAIQKAQETFNAGKSIRLESINTEGKYIKVQLSLLETEQSGIQSELEIITASQNQLGQTIAAIQAEISAERPAETVEATAEYQSSIRDLGAIQEQVAAINNQKQGVLRQVQIEINLIGQDIAAREKSLTLLDQYKKGRKRIEELAAQEKTLAAEYERLDGDLFLTEQFIRAKVNLLESRINSKFKMARFKMFEQQVNEGIKECCETTCGGVPYSGGLNNAARINVGLDIINTLSQHYNFSAPIFVDNAESVTELIPVNAQVISLVVSKPDKVLRVEPGQGQAAKDLGLFKEAV